MQLGIAEGTVSSRLAAARKKLADRLRKRGVRTAGGIAGLLATARLAGADAPPHLLTAAAALGAGADPAAAVCALAAVEVRALFLAKLLTGVALAASVAVAGLWPPAPVAATHPHALRAAPVPPPAPREGVIVVNIEAYSLQPVPALLLTPDGKESSQLALGSAAERSDSGNKPVCPLRNGRLSSDGKRLAAFKLGPIPQSANVPVKQELWVFDLDSKDGPGEPLMTDLGSPAVVWSADGTKLYGSQVDPEKVADPLKKGEPLPLVNWVYDLKTKKKAPLALPLGHAIKDASPDGKSLLTVLHNPFEPFSTRAYIVPLDTLKTQLLTKLPFQAMRFSPDGKSVIGKRDGETGDKPPVPLVVVSVADGSERAIPVPRGVLLVNHACWSPDGKRIAYEWLEGKEIQVPNAPGQPGPGVMYKDLASRVNVSDADGRNTKTILRSEPNRQVTGLDWK